MILTLSHVCKFVIENKSVAIYRGLAAIVLYTPFPCDFVSFNKRIYSLISTGSTRGERKSIRHYWFFDWYLKHQNTFFVSVKNECHWWDCGNGRLVSIIATCMDESNKLSWIYDWVKAFNWFVSANRRIRPCYFYFLNQRKHLNASWDYKDWIYNCMSIKSDRALSSYGYSNFIMHSS